MPPDEKEKHLVIMTDKVVEYSCQYLYCQMIGRCNGIILWHNALFKCMLLLLEAVKLNTES